jgi:hypothetical protein
MSLGLQGDGSTMTSCDQQDVLSKTKPVLIGESCCSAQLRIWAHNAHGHTHPGAAIALRLQEHYNKTVPSLCMNAHLL